MGADIPGRYRDGLTWSKACGGAQGLLVQGERQGWGGVWFGVFCTLSRWLVAQSPFWGRSCLPRGGGVGVSQPGKG